MSLFSTNQSGRLTSSMFLGAELSVSRFDTNRYPFFDKLIEKQLSFFWRPEEIDLSKDRIDFNSLPEHQQRIFIRNLQYQTLLDSVQGRGPNLAFLPVASLSEVENWIETWAFSETIHSRSYTHIMRNVFADPSEIFDQITEDEAILARAAAINKYYDDFIEYSIWYNKLGEGEHHINGQVVAVHLSEVKRRLVLALVAVNVLEAIRFYVSFACSFAFAENKIMEGNAKIIRLIARDEALHLSGTQQMIQILMSGQDGDEWPVIIGNCLDEIIDIFTQANAQEKDWADYLFQEGSMLGLNAHILHNYIDYITSVRLRALGLSSPDFPSRQNPLPWMNNWLRSDEVQVAPQETEISSYLVGAVDSNLDTEQLGSIEL